MYKSFRLYECCESEKPGERDYSNNIKMIIFSLSKIYILIVFLIYIYIYILCKDRNSMIYCITQLKSGSGKDPRGKAFMIPIFFGSFD